MMSIAEIPILLLRFKSVSETIRTMLDESLIGPIIT